MYKRLIIIRHAKSDWKNSELITDFERPLNTRGHHAAPEMANRLLKKGIKPNLLVSSPAVRAYTTATYFAKAWQINIANIAINQHIYEGSRPTLLAIINQFDNQHQDIAIFGHNPGFTELSNYLANSYIPNIPTAGVVVIKFPFNNWAEISGGTGEIVLFDYPKNEG